ncbi:MAG: hypothetical protein IPF46_03580 [Saprospiraceae bacterium]|nr:hypothetical protein [Candidatus Vicinibacter affinis]
MLNIIFEDKDLLVLNKPAGLPCEPDAAKAFDNLQEQILNYYTSSGQKAKNLIAGLAHRLDRQTSGLMVVSQKPSMLRAEIFPFPKAGYKPILTQSIHLDFTDGLSLLDISLLTGRYHQIRATLSYLGHPVWNDPHYRGSVRLTEKRIGLHAWKIEFIHPISNELMKFTCLPVKEAPWTKFEPILSRLDD